MLSPGSPALNSSIVQLVALGIDTVGELSINNRTVAWPTNQFRRVRIPLMPGLLRAGPNTVSVLLKSKVLAAKSAMHACNQIDPKYCPEKVPNPVEHGFDGFNFLRTIPCSAGWDWGIAISPVGIFRPLFIQTFDTAVIRDIAVTPVSPQLNEFKLGDDSSGGEYEPALLLRRSAAPALAWGGSGADW